MQRLHHFDTPTFVDHKANRTLPAPKPRPPTNRDKHRLRSAHLQPQDLNKLKFRDRLCIRTRQMGQNITTGFRRPIRRVINFVTSLSRLNKSYFLYFFHKFSY